jgi:succinate dehydrogenase iron-sulfur subunit
MTTFQIFRFRRGDPGPRFDDVEVPDGVAETVLEALRWIKLHADATLTIRSSCFHASCGTCGLLVNGRERLACVTSLADLPPGSVRVEPMANLPVVADLVVDMAPFVSRFSGPHPITRPVESATDVTSETESYERFEDCIECGLCLSACPVAATDDTYLGPAALAYAQRMIESGRGDRDAILERMDAPDAVWRCHAAFECTEACPSNVRPAERIMWLRGELTRPGRRGN